ncbi:hypothetical protein BKP35_11835 [Anaerobacillus arseniciselenatis]|uniref:histidine kinase n=1 Tax=Anaerobacillus arseniciselenatis TaxID=85682 RepID=A0A1S2LHS1_9BACI|nr:HAMP domain-containing sensor histidine kinase [Anaerobacillus arseniciselenatis]OIJ11623.1 hypothetical protein BKP35_11835 [Anaerobacillus arseniciselenatis]
MDGIESLLLNLLFLIVFLLFVPLFLEKSLKTLPIKLKKSIIIFSFCIAIVSSMSFPITAVEGFIFDLRWIPLVIGILYGGIPVGILLATITIGYRFLIGGEGVIPNLIVCVFLVTLSILLIKRFNSLIKKNRIKMVTSFSLTAGLLQLIVFYAIFRVPVSGLEILTYSVLLVFSAFIVIYTLEIIREENMINQKLFEAEKMKIVSHLASSVSHEVRNPLTVVRGFLQMMEQTEMSRYEQKKFLKISMDEIDRANIIIGDYLSFAKPTEQNMEILNLKKEFQRAIDMIKPMANMNSVEITTKIESCYIKGQSQLFQQCLLNILKNCIEAMPESGELSIETKKDKKLVYIIIEDNGHGMSKEQLVRIGEPYFTTKGSGGTGLGMMTVKRIVDMLDGRIHISSELNKGTRFEISIPVVESEKGQSA